MGFLCGFGGDELSTSAEVGKKGGTVEALFSPEGFVSPEGQKSFVDVLKCNNLAGFEICE